MERPAQRYFCNKCGYVGSSDTHPGCHYFAYPMAHLEQLYIDHLEAEFEALRASPASVPEGMELSAPTILPDGSGFGILSLPLPKDHWLYAEREYEEGALEPKDLPAPILTHALRQQVIDAIRYAVRASTNCGNEENFDPDAMVQNAVYALCGPYGAAAPTPPVSEDHWLPIATAPKDGSHILGAQRFEEDNWLFEEIWHSPTWGFGGGNFLEAPTHWMPLPKAPTMQEDKKP